MKYAICCIQAVVPCVHCTRRPGSPNITHHTSRQSFRAAKSEKRKILASNMKPRAIVFSHIKNRKRKPNNICKVEKKSKKSKKEQNRITKSQSVSRCELRLHLPFLMSFFSTFNENHNNIRSLYTHPTPYYSYVYLEELPFFTGPASHLLSQWRKKKRT